MVDTNSDGRERLVDNEVRRRNILKATATLAAGSTVAGNVHSKQAGKNSPRSFEIKIFQTEDLTVEYTPWGPIEYWDHAKTLEDVISRVFYPRYETANVEVVEEVLLNTLSDDEGVDEVRIAIEGSDIEPAEDSNIMLTRGHTGGFAAGKYCYAGAKFSDDEMGDFDGQSGPLKEPTGGNYEEMHYSFLGPALHEIAHNILDIDRDAGCRNGSCGADHSVGSAYRESGEFYLSPLAATNNDGDCHSDGKNYCCKDIPDYKNETTLYDLNYSDCFWENL